MSATERVCSDLDAALDELRGAGFRLDSIYPADEPHTALLSRGKEQVRRRFLTPRLMRNWLALMHHFEGDEVELDFHDARA